MNNKVYGTLKFGIIPIFISLTLVCLTLFLVYIYGIDYSGGDLQQDITIIVLAIFFGICSIYTVAEIIKVKGEFDNEVIFYYTPWTGSKKEKWDDLIEVFPNSSCSWYKLTFKSGAIIRLSTMIGGHDDVLFFLRELGWRIETIRTK